MRVYLFCQLSRPLIDGDGHLSSMILELNLQSAYMISSDTAIAWVDDQEIAAAIVSKGKIDLTGSLWAIMSLAEDIPSRFLQILVLNDRIGNDIANTVREVYLSKDVLLSFRNMSILIQYPSKSLAFKGCQFLAELLGKYEGVESIDLIAVSEHHILECHWKNETPIGAIIDRTDLTRQSITGLVQDALNLWKDKPMVVAVQTWASRTDLTSLQKSSSEYVTPIDIPRDMLAKESNHILGIVDKSRERIVIICPTVSDAEVLRRNKIIELRGGTIIIDEHTKDYYLMRNDTLRVKKNISKMNISGAFDDHITCTETLLNSESNIDTVPIVVEDNLMQYGANQPSKIPASTTLVLDLKCYVIANYFKLLIKWGADARSSQATCLDDAERVTELNDTLPLWGEDLWDVDENEREQCNLAVILDNKAKNYSLTITSSSPTAAAKRMERIKSLAAIAIRMRGSAAMINWCPQHREALNESNMLREILNRTKAAVLFHEGEDRVISADVVTLDEEDRNIVFSFLAALVPQQSIWSVPHYCVADYTTTEWGALRRTFAVKLDVKGSDKRAVKGLQGSQKGSKSLKVWGFEPSMNEALKFILTTACTTPAPTISSGLSRAPINEIFNNRELLMMRPSASKSVTELPRDGQISDSERENDFDRTGSAHEGNIDWGVPVNDKRNFQGHFTFLDREAGMLYQAYEKYFKVFIYQSFRITMKDSESNTADYTQTALFVENNSKNGSNRSSISAPECPSFLHNQHRTPALKIEFSGSSKKDVYSVRVYLEKISSSNLARQQIHFPRYDAARYRELYNEKTKQEAIIRMMRRKHVAQQRSLTSSAIDLSNPDERDQGREIKLNKNRKGRCSPDYKVADYDQPISAGEIIQDPLQSLGFINIRIRPPLHSRGIRRMTFPADITITICSPVSTESQLADYNTMCRHFSSMDSHYISASIEIPLASDLAKQITVRTTRDDFITRHGLVSLRWDENSLRKDGGNLNSPLNSASMDDIISDGAKEDFSRGRSSSESRREDSPQLGVAKLWATRVQTMKSALDLLCSAGGVIISISMGDDFHDDNSSIDGLGHSLPSVPSALSASMGKPMSTFIPKIAPTLKSLTVLPGMKIDSPTSKQVSGRTIESHYSTNYDSVGAFPTLNGTIDTPQGLKDIAFTDAYRQSCSSLPPPGFQPRPTIPINQTELSENSQVKLRSLHDQSTFISQSVASPFIFCSSAFPEKDAFSYQNQTLYETSDVIESLARQNQAARDAISNKEADQKLYKSYMKQKTISQPMTQRVPIPQFDPSLYVPASSTYNHPTNLPSNLFDFRTSQRPTAVQERFAMSPKARIQAAPGLTLPTDWDDLFQKVENRTPPSSSIPRAIVSSPTSLHFPNQQSNPVINRFSPKIDIENKQVLSSPGFAAQPPLLSARVSPSSRFTSASVMDRSLLTASYGEEYRDISLPADSQNYNYFANASIMSRNERAVPSANIQFRRGSGTYCNGGKYYDAGTHSDRSSPARRMSLDIGGVKENDLRLYESPTRNDTHRTDTSSVAPHTFDASQFLYNSQQLQQQQQQLRSQQSMTTRRIMVHWPHPSLRFMFLGDPLKYQLGDMLQRIRSRGVGIGTPLREKSSPSACLLIEGTNQAVATANTQINVYFRSVIQLVRSVKMILTTAQREILTSADLTRMKEIQGSAGAHIVLDPHLDDISESLSCFDIRLPFSDVSVRANSISDGTNISPSGEIIPLIAVRVVSLSGHKTDISVVQNKLSTIGLPDEASWGVDSHLMLIEYNKASAFNIEEKAVIMKGQILVQQKVKTIIKVWPKCAILRENVAMHSGGLGDLSDVLSLNTAEFSRVRCQRNMELDAEDQARALIDAISEGLATAETMNLSRIALICPTGNIFLFALSADLIRTITVETAVSFLKNGHLRSIQRVVCVDKSPPDVDRTAGSDTLSGSLKPSAIASSRIAGLPIDGFSDANYSMTKAVIGNSEVALLPACGNHMALTVLLLLEQANFNYRNSNRGFDTAYAGRQGIEGAYNDGRRINPRAESVDVQSPAIHLIICNIPLPYTLSAEAVCPAILLAQQQQFKRTKENTFSGLGFETSIPYHMNLTRDQYHIDQRLDGPCVVVIKGLPIGILRAVRAIKSLVINK